MSRAFPVLALPLILASALVSGACTLASVPGTPTLVEDFAVAGDLDRDGRDEKVVLLAQSGGGSGTWSSLAVVGRVDGRPVPVATAVLGDRVQLRSVRIADGRLIASVVRAGPQDPACCPGELAELAWALNKGRLEVVGDTAAGRLSLATLGGITWVLRAWNVGDPAPSLPAVTLTYAEGRLSGGSGCNRYVAGVAEGASPGEISVASPAGTRMACPEAESAVESRFLRRLGTARRFGFRAGHLALWNDAGEALEWDEGPMDHRVPGR